MTTAGIQVFQNNPARWFRLTGAIALFSLALSFAPCVVRAEEFRTPAVTFLNPDWRAAEAQLKDETRFQPAAANTFKFIPGRHSRATDPQRAIALAQLNAITSQFFPNISSSLVPVLLPFDSATLVSERKAGAPNTLIVSRYQAAFRTASFFDAGPTGYDALFALERGAGDSMPSRVYSDPVDVHITGSLLLYNIKDPLAGKGEPVKSLAALYPDLRRAIREGFVRYAFTRFGIPYVVSIQCLDSSARAKRLSCREASPVAERFIKALRVAGGTPGKPRGNIAPVTSERPREFSPDFTYRPPGEIIINTGYRGQSGHSDFTVYSKIRFPIESTPAFANSQSFLSWGDCNFTGRVGWSTTKDKGYHCRRNDKPLVVNEAAVENYSYPWQDNFCESRDFEVGQCANGMGHQGQDIRPSSCQLKTPEADRCMPDIFPTVAVRDGVIVRTAKQQAVHLLINTPDEHMRFRYMHMNPATLDADGVLNGRRVQQNERIGVVSNYQGRVGGTTVHLHFDVQVFTRDGWLWVNPYTTLISAYERQIGGRGREYEPPPSLAPVAHVLPVDAPEDSEKHSEDQKEGQE